MRFIKMQAQGNDFIILDDATLPYHLDLSSYIKRICDRHFGIGADGLVVLSYLTKYDAEMRIFNADGSEAEMCGSALRCVTTFLKESSKESIFKIKTKAGIKTGYSLDEVTAKVNIGKVKFKRENPITICDYTGYYVSAGNPHLVIFTEDTAIIDALGKRISTDPIFKNGVNVEFVKIISPKEVEVRVWERGVGETLACGTGASAVQFVGKEQNLLKGSLLLHFPGGDLKTNIQNNYIFLTGRTEKVFLGEYFK